MEEEMRCAGRCAERAGQCRSKPWTSGSSSRAQLHDSDECGSTQCLRSGARRLADRRRLTSFRMPVQPVCEARVHRIRVFPDVWDLWSSQLASMSATDWSDVVMGELPAGTVTLLL